MVQIIMKKTCPNTIHTILDNYYALIMMKYNPGPRYEITINN